MGPSQYSVPPTQTAVITNAEGTHVIAHDRNTPRCGPSSVLVRVHAVAINPTDHKTPARVKTDGLTSGCDFAGEVVVVGANANKEPLACKFSRQWTVGDKVFGVVYGSNPGQPDWGAFADYVEADPIMLTHMPVSWTMEQAAAVGGSVHGSVAMCLFSEGRLGLSMDKLAQPPSVPKARQAETTLTSMTREELKRVVLVYGGSTACGTMALQILNLAGYIPIATCSARNNAMVMSYGARATFDYHDDNSADQIREFTQSCLRYSLDCLGTAQSALFCYDALGRAGGCYTALEKFPDRVAAMRRAVRAGWVMGPTMFGRTLQLGEGYSQPADPLAREFARQWYPLAENLMHAGLLKSHPIDVLNNRTENDWPKAVLVGLDLLRKAEVSGQKLVVRVL